MLDPDVTGRVVVDPHFLLKLLFAFFFFVCLFDCICFGWSDAGGFHGVTYSLNFSSDF